MINVRNIAEKIDFDYIVNKIEAITPYGNKRKKAMKPYLSGAEKELMKTLDTLEAFVIHVANKEIYKAFVDIVHCVKDIDNSLERCENDQVLLEIELFEIKSFIFIIKELKELINTHNIPEFFNTKIDRMVDLEELLNPEGANASSFYIYNSYSEELNKLRNERNLIEREFRDGLRAMRDKVKEELEINLNAENNIVVPKANNEMIDKISKYPALVYNSESFSNIVFKLKLEDKLLDIIERIERQKQREEELEYEIRESLTKKIAKEIERIRKNIDSLASMDLYFAKAVFAIQTGSVKPEIIDEHSLEIVNGRNPKLMDNLEKRGLQFEPISISLGEGVCCITGANMGGKTMSLKLLGLLSLMAQFGLFVPADSVKLGLNDFIKISIGDNQSTESGLSTFGGEVEKVADAIDYEIGERGLILIDELARGTNPNEGYAITLAVANYLMDKESITVITTHFDKITELDGIKHLQVVGLSKLNFSEIEIGKDEDRLKTINKHMDYRLEEVSQFREVPKDAINIARIMGLKKEIVDYAEEIVKSGR